MLGRLAVEHKGDGVIPSKWRELAEFQLHIAERWRDRGAQTDDPFARFFFYFAGVNALYYFWSKADHVKGGLQSSPLNEIQQIKHLLSKAGPSSAEVLASAGSCIEYFAKRRPIERMDRRRPFQAMVGDKSEGRKARDGLQNGSDSERLLDLGTILYLVRSNLVHGSKMDQGDDQGIIESAVYGLGAILDWAICHTHSEVWEG